MPAAVADPELNAQSTDENNKPKNQKAAAAGRKSQAVQAAKREVANSYEGENPIVIPTFMACESPPPPNLFPDTPVFRTIWASIIKASLSDIEVGQWLAGLPALRAQAEAESALKQREAAALPQYLQDSPPIIGVALERTDSSLAEVIARGDAGKPMDDLEQLIYRYCANRRAGNDKMGGRDADAIADALNAGDDGESESDQTAQPHRTTAQAIPSNAQGSDANRTSGPTSDDDRGGAGSISGGLPESTRGVEEEEERVAPLSPPPPEKPPLPETGPIQTESGTPEENDEIPW